MSPLSRDLLRQVMRGLFKILTRVRVDGLGNVPDEGGCIIAVNHFSRLDPPLVYVLLKRKDVTGLATDKYQSYPLIRWVINTVDGIWINREDADFGALREARNFLQAGGVLGIAPEGTRSSTGGLLPAKTGVAFLAEKTRVPIVPVAIYGTENAVRQMLLLLRPVVHVRFGPPFVLPPIERNERDEALRRNTDEIMCRIAVMLPPEYRGVYATHPRLQELLNSRQPASMATG
jgi:1-acyl-sn-glycerol-3-phosphate acyltransferase